MRTVKDYFFLAAKGFAMGSADVIPGVSGGTIAFITGIYEELIGSIKSIDLGALKVLTGKGITAFWKHINGTFLVAVFSGILVSIFSLVKLLTYLLDHYPVLLWAFFFGLILSSTLFVIRQVKKWNAGVAISLVVGTAIAYVITSLTQMNTPHEWWFVIIAGAIAICAMILPGISGSFLLVIMGQYNFILNSVKELDIKVVASFALGAGLGLITFSKVVAWLFKKYHDLTVAMLTGFMLGSLNKVWPWKTTLETYVDRHGEHQALVQENMLPGTKYEVVTAAEQAMGMTEKPSMLLPAVGLVALGVVLVLVLEKLGEKKEK